MENIHHAKHFNTSVYECAVLKFSLTHSLLNCSLHWIYASDFRTKEKSFRVIRKTKLWYRTWIIRLNFSTLFASFFFCWLLLSINCLIIFVHFFFLSLFWTSECSRFPATHHAQWTGCYRFTEWKCQFYMPVNRTRSLAIFCKCLLFLPLLNFAIDS